MAQRPKPKPKPAPRPAPKPKPKPTQTPSQRLKQQRLQKKAADNREYQRMKKMSPTQRAAYLKAKREAAAKAKKKR